MASPLLERSSPVLLGRGPCGAPAVASAGCRAATPANASAPVWLNISSIEPSSPPPRMLAGLAYDPDLGAAVLFGGCANFGCTGAIYNDTWEFVNGSWLRLNASVAPSPRSDPQMAYDAHDHEILLYGGLPALRNAGATPALNDTWAFSGGIWTNLTSQQTSSPGPRFRGALADDRADGYLVLYGGAASTAATPSNSTWSFAHQHWSNLTASIPGTPGPRARAAMAYDAPDRELVLYGGTNARGAATNQTWIYRAQRWNNVTANGTTNPGRVEDPSMADDGRDATLLLVDGSGLPLGAPTNATWAFAGGRWANRSGTIGTLPPARGEAMAAFDNAENATLLFGGYGGTPAQLGVAGPSGDSWLLGPTVDAAASAAPSPLDLGQAVTVVLRAVAVDPPIHYRYPLLPSGCSTQDLAELVCTPSATGTFAVRAMATDARGSNVTRNATVIVAPDPTIAGFSIVPVNVTLGSAVTFRAGGASGIPPYSVAFHGLPPGCSSGGGATFTCRPSRSGSYVVEAVVGDAAGGAAYQNLTLVVNPPLSIAAFGPITSVREMDLAMELRATVTGGTAPLRYAYTGLPPGCATANGSILDCVPTASGRFQVELQVVDASGWSTNATTNVTVEPYLRLLGGNASAEAVDVGVPVEYWVNVTGGVAPYTYVYQALPPGCQSANSSALPCTTETPGNYSIAVTVSDPAGGRRGLTFPLAVLARPTVTDFGISRASTDVGIPISLTLNWSGGVPPFSEVYLGLPPGCATADATGLSCTPSVSGTYRITASVQDGFGFRSTAVAAVTVNPAPFVLTFGALPGPVGVGEVTTFRAHAAGGTGPLSYRYAGLPPGCSSRNTSVLGCAPTGAGDFDVMLNVSDGVGGWSETVAVVQVVPSAPGSGAGGPFGGGVPGELALGGAVVAAALVGAALLPRRGRPAGQPSSSGSVSGGPGG